MEMKQTHVEREKSYMSEISFSNLGKCVLHLKWNEKASGLCLSGRSQVVCTKRNNTSAKAPSSNNMSWFKY